MIPDSYPPLIIAWIANAAGTLGLLGLALAILFYAFGKPFGTLIDISICLTTTMSITLAMLLLPMHHQQAPQLSLWVLASALIGGVVTIFGSILIIFNIVGWFLGGLYKAAGNALIGLWVLGLTYSAHQAGDWTHGLIILGTLSGTCMALGLAAIPGVIDSIENERSAFWLIKYPGQAGSLGWMVLYPIWCLWMGQIFLGK